MSNDRSEHRLSLSLKGYASATREFSHNFTMGWVQPVNRSRLKRHKGRSPESVRFIYIMQQYGCMKR